jgi:hypothetical protein
MPSPRGTLGRDFVAVNATQFTLTASREAEYQRELRKRREQHRAAETAYAGHDLLPPRRKTRRGYPIEVRNGYPAPMRREITDTARCGCVRRLVLSVMEWELVTRCGGCDA